MPDPSTVNSNSDIPALVGLTDASARFAAQLDAWLLRHGKDRAGSGARRVLLLHRRENLGRIAAAARSAASIGFYGESQCGKSNLVSRLGQSLGASDRCDAPLLIRDESGDRRSPWGGAPIDFAQWLNPVNNKEATGVICRFTSRPPTSAQPGHFVARVLSHRDVLVSLALGHIDEIVPGPSSLDVARELEAIQGSPMEPDSEGFMGALLSAWEFLSSRRLAQSQRLRELDAADWPGAVRSLFLQGKRPTWNPSDRRGSAYLRLAGMLWDCQPELDEVYKRLLDVVLKLNGAEEVSIAPVDVGRSGAEAGAARPSILDVSYIDGLLSTLEASGGVQVHYRTPRGSVRTLGLSRAALASMIRELVLPIAADSDADGGDIDVLDFPGARKSTPAQDFRVHQQPDKLAMQVLRRGKLNQLFLTGVEFHDCSALCLVVSGNGNLEAGPVVRQSLDAWLRREGWSAGARAVQPESHGREQPTPVDPPLVVAVTKSDMLLNDQGNRLFGGRLREIDAEYCGGLPWLSQWTEEGPFTRVHWVHNPSADGARRPCDMPIEAIGRVRASYAQDPLVALHVDRPIPRFDALVSDPPTDVMDLFQVLRTVASGVDRDVRVLESMLDFLEPLVADVARDFIGEDRGARVAHERSEAAADIAFMREALGSGTNVVARVLRAAQLSGIDVQRACRAATDEVGSSDPVHVGILRFEDFYGKLREAFELRMARELSKLESARAIPGSSERLVSIQQHFIELPSSAWFRGRVASRAVQELFATRNPGTLATSPVLGALVSTAWNRSMVWLDEIPPVSAAPKIPPVRRAANASSDKILEHWSRRLSDVYANLVDPRNTALPGNAELGTMREELRDAVRCFRERSTVRGERELARMRRLEAMLAPVADS
jgi:hypothetical protein